jgi:cytochrome P450
MPSASSSSLMTRLEHGSPPSRNKLPPSRRLPAAFETVCCRWLPSAYLEQCHARLGDRFTIYPLGMPPLVFLSDPQDIREILSNDPSCLHPGAGSMMIAPLIGERSFMLLDEEDHISGRRTITPAFHQRMVADHTAMLSDAVEREVASWPMDTNIALHPRIRELTLMVILRAIFSDRDGALQTLHERLMDMLTVTDSIVLQEPKLRHVPGWRKTWETFVKRRAEVDSLIRGLVGRRRSEAQAQHGDLLDMLLSAENPDGSAMSEREIRDNLMSMILAGHETTTGELAWAFQLLAHNPEVQERLVEELDGGTDDAGEEYLTATVHETLRHKPVFLFALPRKVVEPVEIGGWTYRPGVHLMGCTYLMHHNPELYPNPHKFRPERFIEETQQARTWLPWGGGRKHCLGRHFALMEVKAILREVLSTRRVLAVNSRIEHPRWRSAILVPHAGGRVVLRARRR